jgi:hypothetical protein
LSSLAFVAIQSDICIHMMFHGLLMRVPPMPTRADDYLRKKYPAETAATNRKLEANTRAMKRARASVEQEEPCPSKRQCRRNIPSPDCPLIHASVAAINPMANAAGISPDCGD